MVSAYSVPAKENPSKPSNSSFFSVCEVILEIPVIRQQCPALSSAPRLIILQHKYVSVLKCVFQNDCWCFPQVGWTSLLACRGLMFPRCSQASLSKAEAH